MTSYQKMILVPYEKYERLLDNIHQSTSVIDSASSVHPINETEKPAYSSISNEDDNDYATSKKLNGIK